MAIEYSFELDGSTDAEQVSRLMADTAAAEGLIGAAAFGRTGDWLDSGVLVAVSASAELPFPDPVEHLGFTPQVDVLFRYDKDVEDVMRQRRDMVRLVTAVLNAVRADAVLTFAGEIVLLLRIRGQLTIGNQDDFWTPEIQALLPQPHDRASLPVL